VINFFKLYKKINIVQVDKQLLLTNFWHHQNLNEVWFYNFLKHRNLLVNDVFFNFISVFGDVPKLDKKHINIFYCGENTDLKAWRKYKNHLLDKVDIAMGFNNIKHDNYLRFPLWVLYLFPADASLSDVKNIFESYKSTASNSRNIKFSMIASHDKRGTRTKILKLIEQNFEKVICPGKFNNNSNLLMDKYNDNKLAFLQDVVFNVCPENSNAEGYVTEKIFEAISQGCIPIYWGSNNNPEPEILNKEHIIFYNEHQPNAIVNDIKKYQFDSNNNSFIKSNAAAIVWSWMQQLELLILQKIKEKTA
jgi:alpha(1,3/1,4) fucosyltransferase